MRRIIRSAARVFRTPGAAVLLGLFLAFPGGEGRAQDIAPLLPPPAVSGPSASPPLSPVPGGDGEAPVRADPDEKLIERLDAIRFEIAPGVPAPGGHAEGADASVAVRGVDNNVAALAGALSDGESPLSGTLADALGNPLTWRRLDALLEEATRAAREAGWSLARAFAPEQELTSGALRVAVVPVVLEDVDVEGAGWSGPGSLKRPFARHVKGIVNLRDYARPLAFLNQHPFRRVTPLLARGEGVGATRLKLAVTEEKPWRVFSGYETTNSRVSGRGRVVAGFMAVVPWRTDDTVTAQYSTDDKFESLDSAAVSYRAALPWGHFLTATGLWARSDSSPARELDYQSADWLAGLEYTIPLPEVAGWTHEASLGWEWRRFEGRYFLSDEPFDDGSKTDMAPFSLGWRGWRPDRAGLTSLSWKASWNPGNYFGGRMGRSAYESHRSGTDPEFATFSWEVRRDWRLPAGFEFLNRAWGQFGSDRLADPARFFIGGNRSLRGYRESELSGDGGWGVTLELTTPPWRGPSLSGIPTDNSRLEARLAGFWDWGQVSREPPLESWERARQTGAGAGLGLRVRAGPWGDVRVDYGWRLRDTGVEDDDVRGYWHISVNLHF